MQFQIDICWHGDIKRSAPYWISIDNDNTAIAVLLKSINTEVPRKSDIARTDDLKYDFVGIGSSMDMDSGKVYLFIPLAINYQGWMGTDGNSGWTKDRPAVCKGSVTNK